MAIQHFSHLGICVTDVKRSIAFYREVFGFVEVSKTAVGAEVGPLIELDCAELHLRSHFLERDGLRIELMQFDAPQPLGSRERGPFNTLGLTHLAFRVSAIEPVIAGVIEHGGTVIESTRVGRADMGVELIYVLDPDGNRIELILLPGDPTQAPGDPV